MRGASIRITFILKRIFSFPVALSALLGLLAELTVRARFNDPDMWWHLKLGQVMWTTHAIPRTDIFSFTTNHQAAVPHEWLSQLTIFAAYHFAGFSGLMLWMCFFTAALLIAGYTYCCVYSGNAKVALVGALMVWLFATTGMAVRPQMIGYVLLMAELFSLLLGRTRDARWFLALPLLFVLWINCHGSFLLGIVLGCVVLAASFFDFEIGLLKATRWEAKTQCMLAVSLVISAAGLFLNPGGVKQILYPLDTMLHQPINLASVSEWRPVTLTDGRGAILLGVLACIFLLLLLRRRTLYFDELLLLGIGTWMGLGHERMIFLFGMLAAPVLTRLMASEWENYDAATDRVMPNAVVIALTCAVAWLGFPSVANLSAQVEQSSPVKAVAFIKAHQLAGPMLNDYPFGGYLIWAAPEYPVFIDGRADLYEWADVLGQFSDWATLQSPPNVLLDKYGVRFCLLDRGSQMVQVLALLPRWKEIYSDGNAVIFERTQR